MGGFSFWTVSQTLSWRKKWLPTSIFLPVKFPWTAKPTGYIHGVAKSENQLSDWAHTLHKHLTLDLWHNFPFSFPLLNIFVGFRILSFFLPYSISSSAYKLCCRNSKLHADQLVQLACFCSQKPISCSTLIVLKCLLVFEQLLRTFSFVLDLVYCIQYPSSKFNNL